MANTEHFKGKLLDERKRVLKVLGWANDEFLMHDHSIQEAMADSGDNELADDATDTLVQTLDQAYARRSAQRLNAIDAALQRVQLGQYGTCVNCGREIPEGRLEALPETPYCTDCAGELEAQG